MASVTASRPAVVPPSAPVPADRPGVRAHPTTHLHPQPLAQLATALEPAVP